MMFKQSTRILSNVARLRSTQPTPPASANFKRTLITLAEYKYTANGQAAGKGRNGQVKSDSELALTLNLSSPKELGGKSDGHNPEQLFAMGYASCFLGALQAVARSQGKLDAVKNAVIHTNVHLGPPKEMPGFGLAVDIKVEGVEDEELIKAGHEFCPYSRALTHGIVVNVGKK